MIFKITGKDYAFSTFKVAQKFREEYAPYDETRFCGVKYLTLPENRYKIVPDVESDNIKVYDTIEQLLKDHPYEKNCKYINELKKLKGSIPLKHAIVFNNNRRGDEKMVLKCNRVCYEFLQEIIKKSDENIKNKQLDVANEQDVIVDKIYYKQPSSISPYATITFRQYNELKATLEEVDKKIEQLNERYGIKEEPVEESENE